MNIYFDLYTGLLDNNCFPEQGVFRVYKRLIIRIKRQQSPILNIGKSLVIIVISNDDRGSLNTPVNLRDSEHIQTLSVGHLVSFCSNGRNIPARHFDKLTKPVMR